MHTLRPCMYHSRLPHSCHGMKDHSGSSGHRGPIISRYHMLKTDWPSGAQSCAHCMQLLLNDTGRCSCTKVQHNFLGHLQHCCEVDCRVVSYIAIAETCHVTESRLKTHHTATQTFTTSRQALLNSRPTLVDILFHMLRICNNIATQAAAQLPNKLPRAFWIMPPCLFLLGLPPCSPGL